ncbi:MAG: hypothetical protein ACRDPY_35975 [Streptosporangiaceae bacterium]
MRRRAAATGWRRATGVLAILLAVWLPLQATMSQTAEAAPLKLPTRSGVRATLDDAVRFLAGDRQVPWTLR